MKPEPCQPFLSLKWVWYKLHVKDGCWYVWGIHEISYLQTSIRDKSRIFMPVTINTSITIMVHLSMNK